MSVNDVFGEAKFGGSNQTHWFKFPKEGGSLILRILPPYGSMRQLGRWSQYYVTHFGYRDTKGKLRPFESPEVVNRQNKMVEVVDPAMERIKALRTAQEKAKIEKNTDLVKKIGEQLRVFNAKKAHYMNVMDLEGKIGVLSIPHKMYMALDAKLKELKQKGVNGLGAQNGRFFVFTRNGSGINTTHSVEVYRDPNTDQQVVSSLTDEVANRMSSEGVDLGSLYAKPTPQEVAEIVKANGGAVLEAVLAKYRKNNNKAADELESYEEEDTSSDSLAGAGPSTATQGSEVGKATEPAESATVSGKDIGQMSNEEFLKSLGV